LLQIKFISAKVGRYGNYSKYYSSMKFDAYYEGLKAETKSLFILSFYRGFLFLRESRLTNENS